MLPTVVSMVQPLPSPSVFCPENQTTEGHVLSLVLLQQQRAATVMMLSVLDLHGNFWEKC